MRVSGEVSQEYPVGSSSAPLRRTHPRGLPAAGLPYCPPSCHSNGVPGGDAHGKGGGAGAPPCAAFTGKGGGEEEGENDGFVCLPGLQSKEKNPARTRLVHYLSCN